MKSSSKAVKRKASELTTTPTANALSDASSKALNKVLELSKTLQLPDLADLSGEIAGMLHYRLYRFCKFKECTKEKAGTASLDCYKCYEDIAGETVVKYGYFVGSKWRDDSQQYVTKELTNDQKITIDNNPECCYCHGCVCDSDGECECESGREEGSLILKRYTKRSDLGSGEDSDYDTEDCCENGLCDKCYQYENAGAHSDDEPIEITFSNDVKKQ